MSTVSATISTSAPGPVPATRTRRPAAQTREHVLAVAQELFYWEGIRATGIDTVAARADVAPATLYRLFGSKDGLVTAYLEDCDRGYRAFLREATASTAGPAGDRILAVFDAMAGVIGPELCRGCPFLMALAEFPDPASPIHASAVATKAWVRDLLGELAAETGVADPTALADQLALVVEGVYGSVAALGPDGPAKAARTAAAALLAASAER